MSEVKASRGVSGKACEEQPKPAIPIGHIAKVCHEANRVYCELIGDHTQVSWEDAPDWQRNSAIDGVNMVIEGWGFPRMTNDGRVQHDLWMEAKLRDGWRYGPQKSADQKLHPCLLPYDSLPDEQKRKDVLFRSIVEAFLRNV